MACYRTMYQIWSTSLYQTVAFTISGTVCNNQVCLCTASAAQYCSVARKRVNYGRPVGGGIRGLGWRGGGWCVCVWGGGVLGSVEHPSPTYHIKRGIILAYRYDLHIVAKLFLA